MGLSGQRYYYRAEKPKIQICFGICANSLPMNCPWGIKAFRNYLGDEVNDWLEYDSSELIKTSQSSIPLKIDQGSADQFLKDQLKPELLLQAAEEKNFPVIYNLREGYDHSYFFISSFIENHLKFHAKYLI